MFSDRELRTAIEAAFADEARLSDQSIDLSIASGFVTLTGSVHSQVLKDLAQDIAGGISTCIGVVNELTVAGSDDADAPSNSDRPQYTILGNSGGGVEVVGGEAVVQGGGSSGGGFGDSAEVANSEFPRIDDEDFRIIERIGGGGQADVYLGHQVSLDRKVAIKIMDRQQLLAKDELRRRFHEEATHAANLDHPGIVDVYKHGQLDRLAYIVMQLVEGPTFEQIIEACESSQPEDMTVEELSGHCKWFVDTYYRQIATWLIDVANALQFAHGQSVIHRDIKPSNIMLDRHGRVIITDFGLSKNLDDDAGITSAGSQLLGTVRYASPEQINCEPLDVRSDIFSLGTTMCEMLIRQHAFDGLTVQQVCTQVLLGEPVRLREVAPSVPAELEAICRKCLQKKPEDRYASCAEVAEELGCWLKGEPVEALVECEAQQPTGLDRENAEQPIGASPPDPKLKDSATTAPRGRIPDKPDLPEPPTRRFFTRGIAAIGVSSVVLVLAVLWSTGAGTAAVVVRPAEGTALSGERATFEWTEGRNVSEYRISVGSEPGAEDLFERATRTDRSVSITNLPVDGRTLYVTLGSYIDDRWLEHRYTYTAYRAPSTSAAELTEPPEGSQLGTEPVTFRWTGGRGVDKYRLLIGSAPGESDVFEEELSSSEHALVVRDLPRTGRDLYVTLGSLIGGEWRESRSMYTAEPEPVHPPVTPPSRRAILVDPLAGSILPGRAVTFRWGGGDAVEEYRLLIGTVQGGADVFDKYVAPTESSCTAVNLPTNGQPLFVRLDARIEGTWSGETYKFFAAGHTENTLNDKPRVIVVVLEKLSATQHDWHRAAQIELQIRARMTRVGARVLSRVAVGKLPASIGELAELVQRVSPLCDIVVLGRAEATPTDVERSGAQAGWHNWRLSLSLDFLDTKSDFALPPVSREQRAVALRNKNVCPAKEFDELELIDGVVTDAVQTINEYWIVGDTRPRP